MTNQDRIVTLACMVCIVIAFMIWAGVALTGLAFALGLLA
jgi:hypothetical protein